MLAPVRIDRPATCIGTASASRIPPRERRRAVRLVPTGLDDGELVAAKPRQRLVPGHALPDAPRHLDQQRIARAVTMDVVDRLEPVEVQAEQGDRRLLGRAGQCIGEQMIEAQPVRRAGQRIVRGEMRDPRRRRGLFGDVAQHHEVAIDAQQLTAPERHFDIDPLAVAGAQQGVEEARPVPLRRIAGQIGQQFRQVQPLGWVDRVIARQHPEGTVGIDDHIVLPGSPVPPARFR
jgi:hypothetical protein